MSVNGRPNNGDVFLDKDGYLRLNLTNSNGVWHEVLIQPESEKYDLMWLSEARVMPYVPEGSKFLLNIKPLLKAIRKEMQDESSS